MSILAGNILLTGGTGSLGKALVQRAERENWPVKFTIYSRDEVKQGDMHAKYPDHRYMLGDVRDEDRLDLAMRRQDVCLHLAAYKRVPDAEVNADEAIKTNVLGSWNIVKTAIRAGLKQVIGISTDKSCAPHNCYGMSKALMEKLFQQAESFSDTQFNLTRYGNVLGSRGSILELFIRLAKENKPITITDFRMTRFWLTLDDAIDLIISAYNESEGGTIIIPKAPSMSVIDLAHAIAPNSQFIDIGIRPGEKIHETLVQSSEAFHTDDIGKFFRIFPATVNHKGTMKRQDYTSDKPEHWLSLVEMQAMIEKSGGYE